MEAKFYKKYDIFFHGEKSDDERAKGFPFIMKDADGEMSMRWHPITRCGVLGSGLYVSWQLDVAEFYAGENGKVSRWIIPSGLRLLDSTSDLMAQIKSKMGFRLPEYLVGEEYADTITDYVKDAGYDGVASSILNEGIVVFETRKLQELSWLGY